MDNSFAKYYQQTTYKHDYNKSPRGQPPYVGESPRRDYYSDGPRGDRYFREAPREPMDRRYEETRPRQEIQPGEAFYVETHRSPHQSPRSPRRGYDSYSPTGGPPINARSYNHYDTTRDDLPPFNTYAINSTTQHDYGDFTARTTQKDYGDFTQKQQIVSDIRARELARRYARDHDSRPYFDKNDPPSFYKNMPMTDRPGYDSERRSPTRFEDGPLTDRSERNRRPTSFDRRSPPPPANNAFDSMNKGQMKRELDKIELHDGNFKPYSHHNTGGGDLQMVSGTIAHHKRLYERPPTKGPGVLSRPIPHHEHRYENNLMETTSPRRSQEPGVLPRQIENHEHRFESNLVETNNPRRSTEPGVLRRQIEHSKHRYENDIVETNYPRESKVVQRKEDDTPAEGPFCPDILLRPEEKRVKQKLPMHDVHRFERVHKTDNPERIYPGPMQDPDEVHGVFLFIRTNIGGASDVKRAFNLCSGTTPERKLLGFSPPENIHVKEGGDDWKRQSVVGRWDGRTLIQERRGEVDTMLVVNWLHGKRQAKEWVDRDPGFKESKFPQPHGSFFSIIPLKYRPNSGYKTIMVMEFTHITDRNELSRYISFVCKELQRYRADVAFIDGVPTSHQHRPSLFNIKSHVLCHMFCNKDEADHFYNDVLSKVKFQHADLTVVVFELIDLLSWDPWRR
ncbi:uncharacterized protein [Argopecten irradians]|uniref:uncharacterized protein isoform X2 n=1 Tax=Argopecten irradians TaxID=31199 RepID=UPI0037174B83